VGKVAKEGRGGSVKSAKNLEGQGASERVGKERRARKMWIKGGECERDREKARERRRGVGESFARWA
jgi:hypothetical protein